MNDKAFMVFSGFPCDGCQLVFAETRNKAKVLTIGHLWEWDYVDMNVRRLPEYDKYADKVSHQLIDDNDELPEDAPDFYSDVVL